jgi:nucleoside 2-deoxyribosyltransferase
MSKLRLFYAQPVDFVAFPIVEENVKQLEILTKGLPIEIVAPYLDERDYKAEGTISREVAQRIVERDYEVLDTCDILLVDLSREDRQALGIVFEMARAESSGKVIIVYTGGSAIDRRVWIVAVADYICRTWDEVKACLKKLSDLHLKVKQDRGSD